MLKRRDLILAGSGLLGLLAVRPAFADTNLDMASLYEDEDFSEQARLFNGTRVTFRGFMAPPLKPDAKFFVLGIAPMAVCPFCDAAAQWPQDILLIYPDRPIRVFSYEQGVTVSGVLDIGIKTDEETGFVSKIRVLDASYRALPTVSI